MKTLFEKIRKNMNMKWVMEHTDALTKIEVGQTFEAYKKAARYTLDLINEAGLPGGEIINFPADGKTAYQDKRMPLGWKATKGSLTILNNAGDFDDPVVADFERHPFHLVKGSTSTPPEGLKVPIITEQQLVAGQDPRGALVMLDPFTWPRRSILNPILDHGAIGIVTDFLKGRYETPDAVQWVTACTCASNWHVQCDDRDFIAYSVSPKNGDNIRQAASQGALTAHIVSDGERCVDELPAITALIPGKKKEELWILSHMYEPLIDDNSNGVVGSIELARVIKEMSEKGELPEMEFSLRLIFAMEMYGFAAMAEKLDASPKTVIGGLNTDAMAVTENSKLQILFAPPSVPFFGNSLMQETVDFYQGKINPVLNEVVPFGRYGDDNFLSDASVGVPTAHFRSDDPGLWHNSEQTLKHLSEKYFENYLSLAGAWMSAVLTINESQLPATLAKAASAARRNIEAEADKVLDKFLAGKLRDFENEIEERMEYHLKIQCDRIRNFKRVKDIPLINEEIKKLEDDSRKIITSLKERIENHSEDIPRLKADKWFDYAASIVPSRNMRGFPYDHAKVEPKKRKRVPGGILYDDFAIVVSGMDGKKSLQQLIREEEWEINDIISSSMVKKYISSIAYLTEPGYFKTDFQKAIEKDDIVKSLKEAGVEKGDILVVHSSLSAFGTIPGGPETVIDAFVEAVGSEGTLLFPTFTRPYITLGDSINKGRNYMPFDVKDPSQVSVGAISAAAVTYDGVKRSVHPSHSFVAIGKRAEECIKDHKETDPPTGINSPLGKLHEMGAKMIAFGCGLGPTTYLHYLEDIADLPYLLDALCAIRNEDGSVRRVHIQKHLPGHRDFYSKNPEGCKFFSRAIKNGLEIKETSLGLGKVQQIDIKQLYDIGTAIVKEDPRVFLCDDKECKFCSSIQ